MELDWDTQVFSSNVQSVGYNRQTSTLVVVWKKNGKRSAYAGVPENIADELARAPSVGSMMRTEIIPVYQHKYM